VSDPARPALRIVPDELDQLARLARFRAEVLDKLDELTGNTAD
jgi:hypothetical protein